MHKDAINHIPKLKHSNLFKAISLVFSLKCWFKGQMISRSHLSLPNAYRLMCFDKNINVDRDVKLLECDYVIACAMVRETHFNLSFNLYSRKLVKK